MFNLWSKATPETEQEQEQEQKGSQEQTSSMEQEEKRSHQEQPRLHEGDNEGIQTEAHASSALPHQSRTAQQESSQQQAYAPGHSHQQQESSHQEAPAQSHHEQETASRQLPPGVTGQTRYYSTDIPASGPNVTYLGDMPRSELSYDTTSAAAPYQVQAPYPTQASAYGEQENLQLAQYEGKSPRGRHVEARSPRSPSKGAMIVQQVREEHSRPLTAEELAERELALRQKERHFSIRADAYITKELAKAEAKLQRDLQKAETRERADKADAVHMEAMVEKRAERKLAELQQKLASKIAQAKEDRINAEIKATERARQRKIEAEESYRDSVVAAKETAELIRKGEYVPQEPTTMSKLAAKLHL